jgi:hypothetical protein
LPRQQSASALDPVDSSADPSFHETVYVCHGRAIEKEYPIPEICRPVFIETISVGAQTVDVYKIIMVKEKNNNE